MREKRWLAAWSHTTIVCLRLRENSQIVYRNHARTNPWVVVGLSQTCERGTPGACWSVADVQDGFHVVSTVCRSSVRWGSWIVVGLSQPCMIVSMECDWSAAVVREGFHRV